MNTLIQLIPSLVFSLGVALIVKALHLHLANKPSTTFKLRSRLAVLGVAVVMGLSRSARTPCALHEP